MLKLPTSALGNRILLLLAAFAQLLSPSGLAAGGGGRFLVDYSPHPGARAWEGFETVILDPAAAVDLPEPTEQGPTFYAYLSLVEVASHATYAELARNQGLLLENRSNEVWNSHLADLSDPAWQEFVVDQIAEPALRKGFHGFFLDTADSVMRLPGADDPSTLKQYQQRVAALIEELHDAFPKAPLILNRGFGAIPHLRADTLDGVLVESLFQTYDHATGQYAAVASQDRVALKRYIAKFVEKSLDVYVIDYVDPSQPDLAIETAQRIEGLGVSAFVTTPDLQGMVLAPAAPVARKLMVLYGADPALTIGDPKFAPDTSIARHFQAALEWMGYELRFHNVSDGHPKSLLDSEFAGILVESDIMLSPADEGWYADWLFRHRSAGVKILFAGAIPFNHSEVRRKVFQEFGIRGSGQALRGARDVEVASKADLFDYEVEVRPTSRGFHDVQAPAGIKPLLQLTGLDRRGNPVRFDAAFLADWGGVVFDPYWRFQPYSKDTLSYFDPYKLLGALWPAGLFPAPDVTTRQGLRLFWAHVDGDAFATLSTTKRNTTCAEVIRDEILEQYPLPTTVSVIEAEIRAIQDTQNPDDAPRYHDIAREIFRLPHVEAASHAFSHPFVWSTKDEAQQDYYDRRHLHLKASHRFDTIDPRREIKGSVDYINRELLPPGKKVELMLWTGNCRPFAEALRICREIGIEAMNGGFTIYSPRHPQHCAIAPRVTWWDDELQVYAANQNEFVYTDDWSGPTFGGFDQVIRSFEMLETPRRMKPVNVYYHFYSAVFPGSLLALKRVYEWSMDRPLHAITASEASRITRDAVFTRIFRTGPKRWLLVNDGALTTFRIPKHLGYPDLDASTHVTGFNDHGSERYVHTDGSPAVELVLRSDPPERLFLESSEAALEFDSFARTHCAFEARGYRPSQLVFGGLAPGAAFTLRYSAPEQPEVFEDVRADTEGRLVFTLPERAKAILAPAENPPSNR